MHPKNFTERIDLLKRSVTQNSFGEMIPSYVEVGKTWAKISFKSFEKGDGNMPDIAVYQVTFKGEQGPFHRIKWRGKQYSLKTTVAVDELNHTSSVLMKPLENQ